MRVSLLNDVIQAAHEAQQGTYLLVTHNVETARKISDRIALIWEGEVIEQGAADEVFSSTDPFVSQFLAGETAGPLSME